MKNNSLFVCFVCLFVCCKKAIKHNQTILTNNSIEFQKKDTLVEFSDNSSSNLNFELYKNNSIYRMNFIDSLGKVLKTYNFTQSGYITVNIWPLETDKDLGLFYEVYSENYYKNERYMFYKGWTAYNYEIQEVFERPKNIIDEYDEHEYD